MDDLEKLNVVVEYTQKLVDELELDPIPSFNAVYDIVHKCVMEAVYVYEMNEGDFE